MSPRVALLVSYDGTDFAGWQRQDGQRSVQQDIEEALKKLTGRSIPICGSGRTDAGVHAQGQVVHLDLENSGIPPEKLSLALNSHLKRDVRVLKSIPVAEDFHSRYDALEREYCYQIFNGPVMAAHLRHFCFGVRNPLSLARLNQLAAPLVGVHDFSTFAAAGDQSKSRVRQIFQASFQVQGELILFRIRGNAFLWRMVRSITGTILDLAKKGLGPEEMERRLQSKDREEAGPTAPPWGLFLERVDYGSKCRFY